MTRTLISSGSPFETAVGYSRAVVQGDWCFVSGTTGYDPGTRAMPEDVKDQVRNALGVVEKALAQAGFALSDVVRATYYITDMAYWDEIGPVLGGFLVTGVDWRVLFVINVPIGLLGIPTAARLLRDVGARDTRPLDIAGLVTSAAGLVLILVALLIAASPGKSYKLWALAGPLAALAAIWVRLRPDWSARLSALLWGSFWFRGDMLLLQGSLSDAVSWMERIPPRGGFSSGA